MKEVCDWSNEISTDIDERMQNLESDLDKLANEKSHAKALEEDQVKVWSEVLTYTSLIQSLSSAAFLA